MPIIYIHGVATRKDAAAYEPALTGLREFLTHYIAPILNPTKPKEVAIIPVYWGDLGVHFAWNLASRPPTPITGQGGAGTFSPAEAALAAAVLERTLGAAPVASTSPAPGIGAVAAAGPTASGTASGSILRLAALTPDELAELLTAVIIERVGTLSAESVRLTIAADGVAYDPQTRPALAACQDSNAELALLEQRIAAAYQGLAVQSGVAGMGGVDFRGLRQGVNNALRWSADVAGFAASRVVLDWARPAMNKLFTLFLGDIFVYLSQRGDALVPGPIPQRALDALREARRLQIANGGEPIIVLSHSMGGQIVYDLITHFLPQMPEFRDLHIDFWCAAASQIGLFEEMKLFKVSSPDYSAATQTLVPYPNPRQLGYWWNVWDHNDVLSFSTAQIFESQPAYPHGVDDESFNALKATGLDAHGGYLVRAEFYRRFAAKLRAAMAANT
jgi:hypothetical protein